MKLCNQVPESSNRKSRETGKADTKQKCQLPWVGNPDSKIWGLARRQRGEPMVGGKSGLLQVFLWLPHTTVAHTCAQIQPVVHKLKSNAASNNR